MLATPGAARAPAARGGWALAGAAAGRLERPGPVGLPRPLAGGGQRPEPPTAVGRGGWRPAPRARGRAPRARRRRGEAARQEAKFAAAAAGALAASSAEGKTDPAAGDEKISSRRLVYDLFLGLLSLLVLLLNIVEWFIPDDLDGAAGELNDMLLEVNARADTVVCGFFFIDFIVQRVARLSRDRRSGVRQSLQVRLGRFATACMELMFCIPQSVLWGMSIARTVRTFRLVQVMRVLMATKQIGEVLRDVRALSVAVAVAIMSVSVWLFGAFAVLAFEFDIPGTTIRTAEDALWWSAATITTVGYGDAVPSSPGGRTIAVLLMLVGVSVYGATSGLISSFIVGQAQREAQREAQMQQPKVLKKVVQAALKKKESEKAEAAAAADAAAPAAAGAAAAPAGAGEGEGGRPPAAAPGAEGAEVREPEELRGELRELRRELAAQGASLEALHQNMAELQQHMLGLTVAIHSLEGAKPKKQ